MTTQPKVLVLGYGITGQSIYRHLKSRASCVLVDDNLNGIHQEQENLPIQSSSAICLKKLAIDMIYTSPGIKPSHRLLLQAKTLGIPCASDIDLLLDKCSDRLTIIVISGSNGKSTVASMIAHCLSHHGQRTALIGNIGNPVCDIIDALSDFDALVIEMSSFQLHHTKNLRSDVSLLTNISVDHLQWHGNIQTYQACKLAIFNNSKVRIMHEDLLSIYHENQKSIALTFGRSPSANYCIQKGDEGNDYFNCDDKNIPLNGKHHINVLNMAACHAVLHQLSYSVHTTQQALELFQPLAHRQEPCGWHHDLFWINDAKATNMSATLSCLNHMNLNNTWLILGGKVKQGDQPDCLKPFIRQLAGCVIVGPDANMIVEAANIDIHQSYTVAHINDAVTLIKHHAKKGSCVVLSPGCPSYYAYRSFVHCGELFKQAIMA